MYYARCPSLSSESKIKLLVNSLSILPPFSASNALMCLVVYKFMPIVICGFVHVCVCVCFTSTRIIKLIFMETWHAGYG